MKKLEFVRQLRETTGLGLRECVDIYGLSEGDWDKALRLSGGRGFEIAQGKMYRGAKTRRIFSYVHQNRIGVLVEIACETDFAANTQEFADLGRELCLQIASMWPGSGFFKEEPQGNISGLLSQEYIRDSSKTVVVIVADASAKLGENIQIVRFAKIDSGA